MRSARFRFAAALGACAFLITSLSAPTGAAAQARRAAGAHDGVYAVDIYTQQGACDRVYHWTITVASGQVSSPADGAMQASGRIAPNGAVSLAFRRDNQVATVAGKVKSGRASGRWSSPSLQCAGFWNAVRVG